MTTRLPRGAARWWPIAAVVGTGIVFAVVSHTLMSDTTIGDRLSLILAAAQSVALLLSIRNPWPAWLLAVAATASASVVEDSELLVPAMLNSYLVILLVLGLNAGWRTAVGLWAGTLALGVALSVVLQPPAVWASLGEAGLFSGLALVAGGVVRQLIETRKELAQERFTAGIDRERTAALAERTRIARELHDVVVHHMSAVAISVEATRYQIADPPPELIDSLAVIGVNATAALDEMRSILGVLRADGPIDTAPAPTLLDVERLIELAQTSGTAVVLHSEGRLDDVPGAMQVSVYRIVQEALSNAQRHAPGAAVRVQLRRTDECLLAEVRNSSGDQRVPTRSSRPGHGLLGMCERVDVLGGRLETGPTPDGGFRVSAQIPLSGEVTR